MGKMNPYFVFNGETKEAVKLYAKVFNAKNVTISTFGDLPPNPEHPVPAEAKDLVMHALIELEEGKMMFSDTYPGSQQVTIGDNITIAYFSKDEEEIQTIFNSLAEGGNVTMPLQETFWSKCYGQVTDKFGVLWQLSHEA
ncbi:MAG: VOC family protein [Solibacillus sp.]|uniref:VOC family protein n=1 Tax=unclassified Solibacillus TaxID=2637870 RepID=UPI0030FA7E6E